MRLKSVSAEGFFKLEPIQVKVQFFAYQYIIENRILSFFGKYLIL